MDMTTDGFYVALDALNIWHLSINKKLRFQKNNIRNFRSNSEIYEKEHFCTK